VCVFVGADGGPLASDYLPQTFVSLVKATGLPTVRLRDSRGSDVD
jgi:hypothetical protein